MAVPKGYSDKAIGAGGAGGMGEHCTKGTVSLVTLSTNIWERTFYPKCPQEASVPGKPRKCPKLDVNCPLLRGLPAHSTCWGLWGVVT